MYLSTTDSREIISAVERMKIQEGDVVAILLGEKNRPDINHLISRLNENRIDFFGGIFPGLIHGNQMYEEGALILVLPALEKPFLIRELNRNQIELPDFGTKITKATNKKYTAMILVDGLTSNISLFLLKLFNRLGNAVHYFGGGAGFRTLRQGPCLFTPEGWFQNAAIVTFINLECNLGVRHGWERIRGPIVATKTRKNRIAELNWKNAFQVYREAVEGDSGLELTEENFFDIAKGYAFGIFKEGAEDIVRGTIDVTQEGELVCVGEVPENTVLSVLKGKKESLIRAAGQAVDDCLRSRIRNLHQNFLVDCFSRVVFLGGDFSRELETVNRKIQVFNDQAILSGILTLGEISSYGEGFLEYFNKTIVLGVLHEGRRALQ